MNTKVCSKCGVEKALCEFHKNKRSPDGFIQKCKLCRKEWSIKNKDKTLAYREKNKKAIAKNIKNTPTKIAIRSMNTKEIIAPKTKSVSASEIGSIIKKIKIKSTKDKTNTITKTQFIVCELSLVEQLVSPSKNKAAPRVAQLFQRYLTAHKTS